LADAETNYGASVGANITDQVVVSDAEELRFAARTALIRIMKPLAGFVNDSGLSAKELRAIFTEAVVRSAAERQLEVGNRVNLSGISASTGVTRAEISKILKHEVVFLRKQFGHHAQSTNKILSAWHHDPKFTTPNGQPSDLKIYGRGSTFESLVKRYERSIPIRALLDELGRIGAVEVLQSQLVRVKTYVATERGANARMINSFGDRATELLSSMLQNMRRPEQSRYIASISGLVRSVNSLPLFRKEISSRGSDFLAEIQEGLFGLLSGGKKPKRSDSSCDISLTIFYHESHAKKTLKNKLNGTRRNFRRKPSG